MLVPPAPPCRGVEAVVASLAERGQVEQGYRLGSIVVDVGDSQYDDDVSMCLVIPFVGVIGDLARLVVAGAVLHPIQIGIASDRDKYAVNPLANGIIRHAAPFAAIPSPIKTHESAAQRPIGRISSSVFRAAGHFLTVSALVVEHVSTHKS